MGATSSAPRPRPLHHRAPPSRPILKPRTPPRPTLVNLPKTPPTTPKTPTHNPTFADLHHQSRGSGASQSSSPRSSPPPPPPPPPKTRAESLRASYLASQTTDKSWDEVDERWVPSKRKSAPLFSTPHAKAAELLPRAKTEAEVKASQKDAVKEFRKRASAAEDEQTSMDAARTKLEPKIKTWSTEHNKIKVRTDVPLVPCTLHPTPTHLTPTQPLSISGHSSPPSTSFFGRRRSGSSFHWGICWTIVS